MREMRNAYTVVVRKSLGMKTIWELDVNGRIVLKWIVKVG
jgi:hypothetical protein